MITLSGVPGVSQAMNPWGLCSTRTWTSESTAGIGEPTTQTSTPWMSSMDVAAETAENTAPRGPKTWNTGQSWKSQGASRVRRCRTLLVWFWGKGRGGRGGLVGNQRSYRRNSAATLGDPYSTALQTVATATGRHLEIAGPTVQQTQMRSPQILEVRPLQTLALSMPHAGHPL